jgi:acyl dehydratase
MRYWEDFAVGDMFELGSRTVMREEILEVRPSAMTPGRGTVLLRWEATNQDGVVVLHMTGRGLFGRLPAAVP